MSPGNSVASSPARVPLRPYSPPSLLQRPPRSPDFPFFGTFLSLILPHVSAPPACLPGGYGQIALRDTHSQPLGAQPSPHCVHRQVPLGSLSAVSLPEDRVSQSQLQALRLQVQFSPGCNVLGAIDVHKLMLFPRMDSLDGESSRNHFIQGTKL